MRLHKLRRALLNMRMRPFSHRVRGVILAAFIVLLWLGRAASQPPASAKSASPQASTAILSAQAQAQLRSLIDAGTLPGLRWPNFADYRDDVRKFYQSDSSAWVRNNRVTPQAVTMIQIFKQASLKGLNPEDYDASRWDGRLAKIQRATSPPSDAGLVSFDLALTVCAMRYISALRIGRVNPQRLRFSFDAGSTKYDLSGFIRSDVLLSADYVPPANAVTYDGAVVDAVKRFQRRHGLDRDGVLGKGTIAQLNTPLSFRVQQLQLRALPLAPAGVPGAADRRQYPRIPVAYAAPPAGVVPLDEGGGGQGVWPPYAGVVGLHALLDFPAVLERTDLNPARRVDSKDRARLQLSGRE